MPSSDFRFDVHAALVNIPIEMVLDCYIELCVLLLSSTIQQAYRAMTMQIKVVQRANKDDFPGLYCADLIANPWLADSSTLLLSSVWRSQEVILAVEIERSVAAT